MKKIISVLLASLMVFAMFTVSAASAVTINPADVDLLTQSVTITGTGAANSSFVLLVTNPGYDCYDVVDEAVQNIREVKIGENGEFYYSFQLYDAVKGKYKVFADGVEAEDAAFSYGADAIVPDTKAIIDAALDGDTAKLIAKIKDTDVLANISIDKFQPLTSTEINLDKELYATKLSYAIIAENAENPFGEIDINDAIKLQSIIKKIAALELLNQGKDAVYSFNTDGSFKYDSALKVSDVDEIYGTTVYEYYTTGSEKDGKTYTLSPEGKAQVQSALLNNEFVDEEDLYKAFIEAVVCSGVNKSTQVGASGYAGYAHIGALLTSANKEKAEVTGTITTYIEKNLAGYTAPIANIEALNGLIVDFADDEENQGGGVVSGGGVGGGGAPGISAGGTAVIPDKIKDTDAAIQNDKNQTNTYKYKFDDIASVEWAVEAIEYLYTKGIVNGKADRVFDPNGTVTREEIVKMISIAVGLTEESEIVFTDVDASSWAKPFIAKAVKAGVISGIGENQFGFGMPVTRQDIATMLYRVIGAKENVAENSFADKDTIADYAKDAISTLAEMKVINGFEDNTFRPMESCTRAQAAVIIYNYLKTSGLAN